MARWAWSTGIGTPHVIAPLQITVLGAFVSTILGPGSAAQVAFGQTRLVAYNSLAAAVADVGLSFWLVPLYGGVGAATAWAAATVVATGLSVGELAVMNGVHPFRAHMTVPLLATAIPLGLFFAVVHPTLHLWVLPVVGLAVAFAFIAAVVFTRSIDRGDQMFLHVVEELLGRRIPLVRRLGRWALGRNPPP